MGDKSIRKAVSILGEQEIKIANIENTPLKHQEHENYEYIKHTVVSKKAENGCTVAFMEVPPLKSAYPYHFHVAITEVFYIISGTGILETPDGEKKVKKGDVLVFPAGKDGAHKLTNTSKEETLCYLDCDTTAAVDVAFYPNSQKVGYLIEGQENKFFDLKSDVEYYKGE